MKEKEYFENEKLRREIKINKAAARIYAGIRKKLCSGCDFIDEFYCLKDFEGLEMTGDKVICKDRENGGER